MHADHHYEIGSSHVACEDYALSGTKEGLTYAILSDGCSSSKDSDVGARILCHLAKSALLHLQRQKRLSDEHYTASHTAIVLREMIVMRAIEIRASLGLPPEAFDATLLVAWAIPMEDGEVAWGHLAFGDGMIVERYPDGACHTLRMSFDSGAPYYLSYAMSLDRTNAYIEQYGSAERVNAFFEVDADGMVVRHKDYRTTPCTDYSHFMSHDILLLEVPSQIVMFSDGIGTYEDGRRNEIADLEMVKEAMSYKNVAGEFVKRRMRAMARSMGELGFRHHDDLSCAAIHIGEGS